MVAAVAAAAFAVAGIAIAVVAEMNAVNTPAEYEAKIEDYVPSTDGRQIIVTVQLRRVDEVVQATAREDASSVRVSVILRSHRADVTADLRRVDVPIGLASPLDSRSVLDAEGRAVPLRTR